MTVPLIWYLIMHTKSIWVRNGLYGAIGFTAIAIIGTHSRGALLGLLVMGVMFILKSRRKIMPILGALVFAAILPHIAPAEWFERMDTIKTFEEDGSAIARLGAWEAAIVIANKSVTGGGFDVLIPTNGVDAHSIYFEILSEQGYIGLAMFLTLELMTWFKASKVKNMTRLRPDLFWARDLALMIQASLTGYAVSGAFLGLAYFDLYYLVIALVVVLHNHVVEQLAIESTLSVSSPQSNALGGRLQLGRDPGYRSPI